MHSIAINAYISNVSKHCNSVFSLFNPVLSVISVLRPCFYVYLTVKSLTINILTISCFITFSGPENRAVAVLHSSEIQGGSRSCRSCTLDQCLTLCYQNNGCQGVDYNRHSRACYQIAQPRDTCGQARMKKYCIHVSLQHCG